MTLWHLSLLTERRGVGAWDLTPEGKELHFRGGSLRAVTSKNSLCSVNIGEEILHLSLSKVHFETRQQLEMESGGVFSYQETSKGSLAFEQLIQLFIYFLRLVVFSFI